MGGYGGMARHGMAWLRYGLEPNSKAAFQEQELEGTTQVENASGCLSWIGWGGGGGGARLRSSGPEHASVHAALDPTRCPRRGGPSWPRQLLPGLHSVGPALAGEGHRLPPPPPPPAAVPASNRDETSLWPAHACLSLLVMLYSPEPPSAQW
ncbi:hypothetical protein BDZ91DRAFT_826134 [Kalaharituber pfeilii]|nr:hypothetical protein BDZ91DRAFT_826134 [Kalaharituber pfeilii]